MDHRPGPWSAIRVADGWDVVDQAGYTVCELGEGPDAEANARLLAAAPMLYETMLEIATACEGHAVIATAGIPLMVFEAIAIVKGETP